jgi:hypothetical protein
MFYESTFVSCGPEAHYTNHSCAYDPVQRSMVYESPSGRQKRLSRRVLRGISRRCRLTHKPASGCALSVATVFARANSRGCRRPITTLTLLSGAWLLLVRASRSARHTAPVALPSYCRRSAEHPIGIGCYARLSIPQSAARSDCWLNPYHECCKKPD